MDSNTAGNVVSPTAAACSAIVDDLATNSVILEDIQYFLGSAPVAGHNSASVAEEIEVETSSIVLDSNGNQNQTKEQQQTTSSSSDQSAHADQHGIIKYACCEVAVTLASAETESENCQSFCSDDADMSHQHEAMQVTSQTGHVACIKAKEEEKVASPFMQHDENASKSAVVEEKHADCENPVELLSEMESMDLGQVEQDEGGDMNEADNIPTANTSAKTADNCKDTYGDGGGPLVVRPSCIRWASTREDDTDDENATGATAAISKLTHQTNSVTISSVVIHEYNDDQGEEGGNPETPTPFTSQIFVPEITMTIIKENDVVPIIDVTQSTQQFQQLQQQRSTASTGMMMGQMRMPPTGDDISYCCCVQHCCKILNEVFSTYFPLWMGNQINPQEVMRTCFQGNRGCNGPPLRPPPPPGFEDPPEHEWVTATINEVDHSDGALRYKCRNCEGFVEYRSQRQIRHLRNLARLKYECEECHRKYLTRKQLKLHSLRHQKKTQVCNYCDKRFLTPVELQNHTNTHTRERPYACPVCSQKFTHSSRYYVHVRNWHKKYDCNDCYTTKACSSKISSRRNCMVKPSTSKTSSLCHNKMIM